MQVAVALAEMKQRHRRGPPIVLIVLIAVIIVGGVMAGILITQSRRWMTVTISNANRPGIGETPHSGDIVWADGKYWWYGETYHCGFVWGRPSPYCGVIVYQSTDLVHWHGPSPAFNAATPYWQTTCMGQPREPNMGCFRPKVIYDAATHDYVMWLNVAFDGYRALTSRTPQGPFVVAGTPNLHDQQVAGYNGRLQPGNTDGDENLWVDRQGHGYVVWDRYGRLLIERLTSDDLSGAGQPVQIDDYPERAPYYGAEAPSLFQGPNGTWWITFSLPRCPYCTAATGLEEASSALGPWHYVGTLSATSGGGQPDNVSVLPGGAWLYSSDLWRQPPGWPATNETKATQHWEPLRFQDGHVLPLTDPITFKLKLPKE